MLRSSSRFLLLLIYAAFVSLGLPDGAFGVAWPEVYTDLNLPLGLGGTIITMGTIFTGLSALASDRLLVRWSTGPVVLASCLLTALGLLIISQARGAVWLYVAAIPLGFGAGAVDASMNGFVAKHYSSRQMNWMHACWGIGATGGPLIIGQALAWGQGWRGGYLGLGSVQIVLALAFALTLHWWRVVPEATPEHVAATTSGRAAARSTAGWLSPLIFALYVAVEFTTGIWAATVLIVGRGFSPAAGATGAACFYAAITAGRILVGLIADRVGNRRLVTGGSLLALAGAGAFALLSTSPVVAAITLAIVGLGFAPIYPCLMHEVPRRFVPEAVQTVIGRQSGAAAFGAGLLPALAGWVAQQSLSAVPWVVVGGILLMLGCIHRLNRLT